MRSMFDADALFVDYHYLEGHTSGSCNYIRQSYLSDQHSLTLTNLDGFVFTICRCCFSLVEIFVNLLDLSWFLRF